MSLEKNPPTKILSKNLFPVVGVGASAGGLDAFKELVKAIPENSGMAYILVQHLAPQHESMLTEILQKATKLPVVEIIDKIKVLPNHIYIIPSNRYLTANDGALHLDPLSKGQRLNTIDVFFSSLAEIHQNFAIGCVLSGTGTDGTIGLKTIKDQGGITIAQDEASSAYFAMPQSAINSEVVDFILPPRDIPAHLIELSHNFKMDETDFDTEELNEDVFFKQVIGLLKAKYGVDFSYYKQSTIRRRILRRKSINKLEYIKEYQDFLFENKSEQDALLKDILIPVTAFFRDAKSFEVLGQKILPDLLKDKTGKDPLRVWVAGCSTGEEAYSVAICLHQYFQDKVSPSIQIFASDISEQSINKARTCLYNKRDMAGISDEQINRYFTKINGDYQLNKMIREMCVFAHHNFLKDPPFAKMDLICCRNVLIYMEPYLQKKALTTFHYALNPRGVLFLGHSESTSSLSEQFIPLSKQEKFFKKSATLVKYMPVATAQNEKAFKSNDENLKKDKTINDDFQKAANEAILLKYAPVGVIVNEQLDIVQFRGATGDFLEAAPGKASHSILKMAKEGLAYELRIAFDKARTTNKSVIKESVPLEKGDRRVNIEVIPLINTVESYFLVSFWDAPTLANTTISNKKRKVTSGNKDIDFHSDRIEQLEKELVQAHEELRNVVENCEAASEELQSANEELLSGSEELQTLNEELESTKEEIQSTNEELTVLNSELIERNEQIIYSRKYAEAIIATLHEPIIVLTNEFRIKSANKSFYQRFEANEKELEGEMFFQWQNGFWNVPGLLERFQKIIPEQSYLQGLKITVVSPSKEPKVLELNARQIITEINHEQLILLAIHDITERDLLDKAQKHFADELVRQVEMQTKDLKEANTELKYSNENLQQFAFIASHDLQEPLRKIRTFTTLLSKRYKETLPDEGKELVEKINKSAARMSQLIKEVLEYSNVAHGVKEFSETNLDHLFKSVLNDLDLLISETSAKIVYDKPLPTITAIPLQMNQLFYNLLANALKFIKRDTTPEVRITFKMLSPENVRINSKLSEELSYLEIIFADNGIGIDQPFAEQIFHLFERLHTSSAFEGTGVGLALCKKIVENHKGDIFVKSMEGKGASFYIVLPINQ